jgi:DNA-binding transcriptional ArsR family regulator
VAAAQRAGESKKKIVDVVSHAVRHKTRVGILIVLNEGTFTTGQIAHVLDEPVKHVSNHVRELLDAGSIEIAKEEEVRNTPRYWYRAVKLPHYTDEEVAAMTDEEVQVTAGLAIQSMVAEILAGLNAGRMPADPRLWIAWDWFNVDRQGRGEIADEQEVFWDRMRDIEVAAINRSAETGEETTSILVTQTGFPRARKGPNPPNPSDAVD